jgi:hypothetical protein
MLNSYFRTNVCGRFEMRIATLPRIIELNRLTNDVQFTLTLFGGRDWLGECLNFGPEKFDEFELSG